MHFFNYDKAAPKSLRCKSTQHLKRYLGINEASRDTTAERASLRLNLAAPTAHSENLFLTTSVDRWQGARVSISTASNSSPVTAHSLREDQCSAIATRPPESEGFTTEGPPRENLSQVKSAHVPRISCNPVVFTSPHFRWLTEETLCRAWANSQCKQQQEVANFPKMLPLKILLTPVTRVCVLSKMSVCVMACWVCEMDQGKR